MEFFGIFSWQELIFWLIIEYGNFLRIEVYLE